MSYPRQMQEYRDEAFGVGGESAGPYTSNEDAWRNYVKSGKTVPLQSDAVGAETLTDWDPTTPTAVPEAENADGMITGLRCHSYIADGAAVGADVVLYDAVEDEAVGVQRGFPELGAGQDGGLERAGGAADGDTSPGYVVALYDGSSSWTLALSEVTRPSGAAGFVETVGTVPQATGPGFIVDRNEAAFRFSLRDKTGTLFVLNTRAFAGTTHYDAGNAAVSDALYHVVLGIRRIDAATVEMSSRLYSAGGALEIIRSRNVAITAANMPDATDDMVIKNFDTFRVYAGTNLNTSTGTISDISVPLADEVVDGTDTTAGGAVTRDFLGLRTGVFRPSSPTDMIVSTDTGGAPVTKVDRRTLV